MENQSTRFPPAATQVRRAGTGAGPHSLGECRGAAVVGLEPQAQLTPRCAAQQQQDCGPGTTPFCTADRTPGSGEWAL